MHAAAHEAGQRELLCTCNAFHRPHPHHGPAGAGPAGDGSAGDADCEHDWVVTEDPDGHLTRLRIPGEAFLRLIDGAERKLAASRAQSEELRQRHKPGQ